MALTRVAELAGASYFDPKPYMTALAILVEPKSIAKQVPSTYQGKTRLRDEVVADISVFANQADLESGKPSVEIKTTKVVHGMLTSTLEKILGGATVAVIRKVPTQQGSGYAFRPADTADEAKVEAYYEAREAQVAAALDEVPDFEDD